MLASMLLLGFVLGLRHALEADHVAAVAALATRTSSRRDLLRLATGWGAGHGATPVAIGAVATLLGATLPAHSEELFDRVIGLVLVGMGLDVLRRAWMRGVGVDVHEHPDGTRHVHLHSHAGRSDHHEHAHAMGGRAVALGMLHGLAGSAPVVLLALPRSVPPLESVAYLATFGIGSIAGMLAFSLALSVPLRAAAAMERATIGLEAVLGGASIMVGMRMFGA